MAIPKVIHYCWFGGTKLPDEVLLCINSWKKYCPDYEIIQWDEQNYDYKKYRFSAEAYAAGKWAFVSDVARLDIIYHYGGIYLDTDVELIKPLDFLLKEKGFMGMERGRVVATGLGFGAEKGNKLIKANLECYIHESFLKKDGTYNLKACPIVTTDCLEAYGLERRDSLQDLGEIKIFPSEYFCPQLLYDGSAETTEKTVSIHHYMASWTTEKEKQKAKRRIRIYTFYGKKVLRIYDGIMLLKENGGRAFLKRLLEIIKGK